MEHCQICDADIGDNGHTCQSCGGRFCADHVKETELGLICQDDIDMLGLEIIDESES